MRKSCSILLLLAVLCSAGAKETGAAVSRPEYVEELVYSLPAIGPYEDPAGQPASDFGSEGDYARGSNAEDPFQNGQQEDSAGADASPSKQASSDQSAPAHESLAEPGEPSGRAVALYGGSGPSRGGRIPLFGIHDRRVSALGLVTGINRNIHAPLGMYQLASGGPDGGSRVTVGESSFSRNIDLGTIGISPTAGVYWYSDHYTSYYYGVSRKEAERQGLRERESLRDVTPFIGLTIDIDLAKNWSAFVNCEVSLPGQRFRENTFMDKAHSESVTTGIIFTFN